jgi:hypothetical protein
MFPVFKEKNIFRCQLFNSDDVVMIRENWNFHLRLFVKSGSLHGSTPACRRPSGGIIIVMSETLIKSLKHDLD